MERTTNQEDIHLLEQEILFLEELVPGLKVKYMWNWIEKFYTDGAKILGKTIFLKRILPLETRQRLVAHDAVHVFDKKRLGWFKYHWTYAFKKLSRLKLECRGYAIAMYIYTKQGGDLQQLQEAYTGLLHNHYKLKMDPKFIDIVLGVNYDRLLREDTEKEIQQIKDWWDEQCDEN